MIEKRQNMTIPQIELVEFLGNRSVTDNEINDIKRLISIYYVRKADDLMEGIWEEKGLSEQKMNEILDTLL